jgi:hypothetical protein
MTKFTILGVAAILSTTLATPILAQAIIQEPSTQNKGAVLDRASANAMAFVPPGRLLAPGNETTTRPWSAPVGHRQPSVADIPASTSVSQQTRDQEDANVERAIRGVCRGC